MSKTLCILLFTSFFGMLSAQELTMFSGFFDFQYYQDEMRIEKKEVHFLIQQNEEANFYWKKSKVFSAIAYSSIGISIVSIITVSNNEYDDEKQIHPLSLAGYFFGLTSSVLFSFKEYNYKKKAILKYNSSFDAPKQTYNSYKIKGVFDNKGVGLRLQI